MIYLGGSNRSISLLLDYRFMYNTIRTKVLPRIIITWFQKKDFTDKKDFIDGIGTQNFTITVTCIY